MTQTERLIALLRQRGAQGVTPLEALDLIGSYRLAARVHDAKKEIGPDEEIVDVGYRTNGGARVARYVLRRKVPNPSLGVQEVLWEA